MNGCRPHSERALCRSARLEQGQDGQGSRHGKASVAPQRQSGLADRRRAASCNRPSRTVQRGTASRKRARGHWHPKPSTSTTSHAIWPTPVRFLWSGMSTNGGTSRNAFRSAVPRPRKAARAGTPDILSKHSGKRGSCRIGGRECAHPSVIAEYVRTYLEERKRLSANANAKRAHLETRLGELNREIDRLVDAIAKGQGDPAVLGPRSTVLDGERKQDCCRVGRVEPPASNEIVALHPAMSWRTTSGNSATLPGRFIQRNQYRRFSDAAEAIETSSKQ